MTIESKWWSAMIKKIREKRIKCLDPVAVRSDVDR